MTKKLNRNFEFQIQYRTKDGLVETLSCTSDRKLLHDHLDELLDKSMDYPQPPDYNDESQTIFRVWGAGCPIHPTPRD